MRAGSHQAGGRLGRDLLPALAVGLLVFHLVRTHLLERYRVTSRSMEPTLHGDPADGDIVLVDRTAWVRDEPEPWDLVVVRNRDNPTDNHLVKRLLAVGPGDLDLREGDLFFGHGNDLRRVRKDPVAHRTVRITHAKWAVGEAAPRFLRRDGLWECRMAGGDRAGIALRAGADDLAGLATFLDPVARDARRAGGGPNAPYLPGHLSLRTPVDASFVDGAGRRDASGGPTPRDIGFELDVVRAAPGGAAGLQLVYEYAEFYFALGWDLETGRGTFRQDGEVLDECRLPAWAPGRGRAVEFGYLDGRFFLVVDGAVAWERAHALPRQARLILDRDDRLANLLHVGCAGGEVGLRRVRVFRDAHYHWDPARRQPFRLEVGEIFVVGDNAYDSSDSRHRPGDPFEVSDLIGRPFAILGPTRRGLL